MLKTLILAASVCLFGQDQPLTQQEEYGLAAKIHYDKARACDRVVVQCLDRLEAAKTDEERARIISELINALAAANKNREATIRMLLASIYEHQHQTQAKK